jgi:glycosyltransferase involved in cell wall biosynthesis
VKVGIDVAPLRLTRAGTARVIEGLLPGIDAEPDIELERFDQPGTTKLATIWRDTGYYLGTLPRHARQAGCDVLHCPTYRAPIRSSVPLVVTVHDLALFRHPELFNRWSRLYSPRIVPRVAAAARRIIAVSAFTASELHEILRVPMEKIAVIPNAVDPHFADVGSAAPGEYLLAVGTLEPRKNLPRIAAAARRAGLPLRIVGGPGWGGVAVPEGAELVHAWSSEELAPLYRGARALVYASLYEGFGIPILEAMAAGTPVVTSAGGATEETAGGAAVLVDPLDVESIAAGIAEADSRRAELVPLGRARANEFSWAASAKAVAAVYREAAA